MFDFIAYPLGKFLLFIYNTVAFHNYGLSIIFFTIIIRLALLPLTLKQYKSSAKMQELQPMIADIQKRYKDDKEKLNQEMMKVYQENNYNPASGCLPLLVQMPILITLYYVVIEPLKFMLSKDAETITKIAEVAAKGLGTTVQKMGFQKELLSMNYFNEHKDALSQVSGLLNRSELIDFNNFLGLHLGKVATYKLDKLFGPETYIYLPLFILVVFAVVTTYFSSRLAMPRQNQNNNSQQNAMASSMTNSMLYIGPLMTLMFGFQLPGGVVLYWMAGYVVAICQQLYINKYVLKRNGNKDQKAITGSKPDGESKQIESGNKPNDPANGTTGGASEKKQPNTVGNKKSSSGSGKKGSNSKRKGAK